MSLIEEQRALWEESEFWGPVGVGLMSGGATALWNPVVGGVFGGLMGGIEAYRRTGGDGEAAVRVGFGGGVGGFLGGVFGRVFSGQPLLEAANRRGRFYGCVGSFMGSVLGSKYMESLGPNPHLPAPSVALPERLQEIGRRIGADGSAATTAVEQQWLTKAADMREVSRDLKNTDFVNAAALDPALP